MAVKILALIISCAAVAEGWAYVRMARRVSSFLTTRGTVVRRGVTAVPTVSGREGRWGNAGGYQPTVTYTYVVDGVGYTSDRWGYATQGLKRIQAERALAAVPDEVDVHYDPAAPQVAYRHMHTSRIGYVLVASGAVGVLLALATLLG